MCCNVKFRNLEVLALGALDGGICSYDVDDKSGDTNDGRSDQSHLGMATSAAVSLKTADNVKDDRKSND